jgi:hypothetical protein
MRKRASSSIAAAQGWLRLMRGIHRTRSQECAWYTCRSGQLVIVTSHSQKNFARFRKSESDRCIRATVTVGLSGRLRGEAPVRAGRFFCPHVAFMSHGVTATLCNSLKQEGNSCDTVRHETGPQNSQKPLILLAIPAEFVPCNNINALACKTPSQCRCKTKGFLRKCKTLRTPRERRP